MSLPSADVCCGGSQISITAVGIQALSRLSSAQSWEGEHELGAGRCARLCRGSKHYRLCSALPNNSISMTRRSAASTRLAPSEAPLLLPLIIQNEGRHGQPNGNPASAVSIPAQEGKRARVCTRRKSCWSLYATTYLLCISFGIMIFILSHFRKSKLRVWTDHLTFFLFSATRNVCNLGYNNNVRAQSNRFLSGFIQPQLSLFITFLNF